MKLECPRCLNRDPNFFYHGSKGWYCRKCISFGRALIEENHISQVEYSVRCDSGEYTLQYPLTNDQMKVSTECMNRIHNTDVLIHAVCGAGKTEIVMATISSYLKENKKVCFAIARRQVVLEVGQRLQGYYKNAKVVSVCGGHTDEIYGDIIVCTTHQLYRYYKMFDLLILDEPDAFPFRGNDVLHGIAQTACIGHIIYLTATPDVYLQKRMKDESLVCLRLNTRPHGKPLPVPKILTVPNIIQMIILLHWIKKHENHPRMIFVPTIQMANSLYRFLTQFWPIEMCTSKQEDRDIRIERFRNEPHGVIVCTTVLERGVTIPHADICVMYANHQVFDEAGLIQIAGRAGRDFHDPNGDVLFLCSQKSSLVKKCQKTIMEANLSCTV